MLLMQGMVLRPIAYMIICQLVLPIPLTLLVLVLVLRARLQVMALWLLAYVIIGQVALPIVLTLLGIDRDAMSIRGHALLHLSLDMSQVRPAFELCACVRQLSHLRQGDDARCAGHDVRCAESPFPLLAGPFFSNLLAGA